MLKTNTIRSVLLILLVTAAIGAMADNKIQTFDPGSDFRQQMSNTTVMQALGPLQSVAVTAPCALIADRDTRELADVFSLAAVQSEQTVPIAHERIATRQVLMTLALGESPGVTVNTEWRSRASPQTVSRK